MQITIKMSLTNEWVFVIFTVLGISFYIKSINFTNMPILRSIINLGKSQAVTLPKSWLRNAEDTEGKKAVAIAMEIDGSITLKPVFEKEQKASVPPRQERHTSQQSPNRTVLAQEEATVIDR